MYDWSAVNAARYWSKASQVTIALGPFDLIAGDDQIGIDGGLGFGTSVSRLSVEFLSSVSLTYNEWGRVESKTKGWNRKVEVRNIEPIKDANGVIVGYEGNLFSTSNSLFGFGKKSETDLMKKVYRKIYDKEDNAWNWRSADYINESYSENEASIIIEPPIITSGNDE